MTIVSTSTRNVTHPCDPWYSSDTWRLASKRAPAGSCNSHSGNSGYCWPPCLHYDVTPACCSACRWRRTAILSAAVMFMICVLHHNLCIIELTSAAGSSLSPYRVCKSIRTNLSVCCYL